MLYLVFLVPAASLLFFKDHHFGNDFFANFFKQYFVVISVVKLYIKSFIYLVKQLKLICQQ